MDAPNSNAEPACCSVVAKQIDAVLKRRSNRRAAAVGGARDQVNGSPKQQRSGTVQCHECDWRNDGGVGVPLPRRKRALVANTPSAHGGCNANVGNHERKRNCGLAEPRCLTAIDRRRGQHDRDARQERQVIPALPVRAGIVVLNHCQHPRHPDASRQDRSCADRSSRRVGNGRTGDEEPERDQPNKNHRLRHSGVEPADDANRLAHVDTGLVDRPLEHRSVESAAARSRDDVGPDECGAADSDNHRQSLPGRRGATPEPAQANGCDGREWSNEEQLRCRRIVARCPRQRGQRRHANRCPCWLCDRTAKVSDSDVEDHDGQRCDNCCINEPVAPRQHHCGPASSQQHLVKTRRRPAQLRSAPPCAGKGNPHGHSPSNDQTRRVDNRDGEPDGHGDREENAGG